MRGARITGSDEERQEREQFLLLTKMNPCAGEAEFAEEVYRERQVPKGKRKRLY